MIKALLLAIVMVFGLASVSNAQYSMTPHHYHLVPHQYHYHLVPHYNVNPYQYRSLTPYQYEYKYQYNGNYYNYRYRYNRGFRIFVR